MAAKIKPHPTADGWPKVVIHNRRFWRRYPDGRMERIYLNERIKSALSQTKAMEGREATET